MRFIEPFLSADGKGYLFVDGNIGFSIRHDRIVRLPRAIGWQAEIVFSKKDVNLITDFMRSILKEADFVKRLFRRYITTTCEA